MFHSKPQHEIQVHIFDDKWILKRLIFHLSEFLLIRLILKDEISVDPEEPKHNGIILEDKGWKGSGDSHSFNKSKSLIELILMTSSLAVFLTNIVLSLCQTCLHYKNFALLLTFLSKL